MHQRVAIDGCRMLCSHVDCRVPIDTPYLTYMCTRWLSFRWLPFSYRCISYICSLVDCRFPIYTSRILYSHLLIVVFLLMHPYAYAHSLIVVSHRCITYVYAQTLIVLYLQFLFQYPSIDIDKCLSYARQTKCTCNDKTDRRCIVVSMLCKWYSRDRRARWYQDLSNLDIAHK